MTILRICVFYILLLICSCNNEDVVYDDFDISKLCIEKKTLSTPLLDIDFSDDLNGIGIDTNNIYRTNDGGINWAQIYAYENLSSVHLFGKNDILISGRKDNDKVIESFILVSDNAGATFEKISLYDIISSEIFSISTFPDGTAYITTHNGIIRSIDFGKSWEKISNINIPITKIIKKTDNELFCGSNGGVILTSINNGVNWSEINTKFDNYTYIKQIVGNRIYFFTDGTLFSTENFHDYENHNININNVGNFLHVMEDGKMAYFGSKYSNVGGFVPNGIIYLTSNNGENWSENDFGASEGWSGFKNGIKITQQKVIITAIEGYENNQLLHINFN